MIIVADLAAHQATRYLVLRPGTCLALTFRILCRTTWAQRLQPSPFPSDKSHRLPFHAWTIAEGRSISRAMPPKQATLGYVKSSQQTMGCRPHCCSHQVYSILIEVMTGNSSEIPMAAKLSLSNQP